MKALLFATACAIAAPFFSQSGLPESTPFFLQSTATGTVSLLDSSISYSTWSTVSNTWAYISKSIYNYNTFNKTDAEFIYRTTPNTWMLTGFGKDYVYDANYNLLEKTYEALISGSWVDQRKYIYTYDSSDNMLSELFMTYNSGWVNDNQLIYTYSGNKQTSFTRQTWNVNTNSWENVWKIARSYNTNDQIISTTTQDWISGGWVNRLRSLNYSYTGSDLISYETETWNTSTASYDPHTKASQTYDINHRLVNNLTLIWNSGTASWETYQKTDYTYDVYGNMNSSHFQAWHNPSSTWTNIAKSVYYYRTGHVGLNESSVEKSPLILYPDPCSDRISVSTPGKEIFSTVSIKDLSGKTVLIQEANQTGSISIDVQALEAGMYFMELRNETGSAKGKFIKN